MASDKKKQRIQLDLGTEQVVLMDTLGQQLALRSRADLLQQAFSLFLWAVDETLAGHRIISVDLGQIQEIAHYKEVNIPALQPFIFHNYQYLIDRPHPWKKQLFLKGRNMSVGQLISTMAANSLSPEATAEDLELPLEQVQEALVYYQTHKTLIDLEAREEAARLLDKGYDQNASSQALSG